MATYKFDINKAFEQGYTPQQVADYLATQQSKGKQYEGLAATPQEALPQEKPGGDGGLGNIENWYPILGSLAGGAVGSLAGPAGTIAGAAAGGALGETAKQSFDTKEGYQGGEILKEGVLGGVGSGVGSVAAKVAGKVIPKVADGAAKRISNSVFREPIKDTKAAVAGGQTLGEEALVRGQVGTTQKLYQTATTQIDNTENTLQQILMNAPQKVDMGDIRKTVQPMIDKYKQSGNVSAAQALETRLAGIESANGAQIPAAAANQIKRSLYSEADAAYGTEASANMEGIKAMARGIKEALEPIPGVKQLNKDLSFYGRQRDSMIDKMTRDERNSLFGLTDTVLAGGGLASGFGAPAAGALIVKKAGETAIGRTAAAQGLHQVATNPLISAGGTMAAQIAAQGGVRLPQGLGAEQSSNANNNNNDPFHNQIPSSPAEIGYSTPSGLVSQEGDQGLRFADGSPAIPGASEGLPETPPTLTGYAPQELYQAYIKATTAGDKTNAAFLKSMYSDEVSFQKEAAKLIGKGAGKTEKQQSFANAAEAGQQALDLINSGQVKTGIGQGFVGQIGEKIGTNSQEQQVYRSTIAAARTMARNAMLGANMTDKELESMGAFIPEFNDAPSTAQQKLQTFVSLMNQFGKNFEGTTASLPQNPADVVFAQ